MAAPRNMTRHALNPLKGKTADVESLDFTTTLDAAVTIDPLYGGRCAHVCPAGTWKTGVPATSGKVYMPCFLFQDSDSPDVKLNGGLTGSEADDPNGFIGLVPRGGIKGFVATGGFELESTEFEPEADLGSTYAPGDPLKAVAADTTAATGGRLTKGILGTDVIVGTVSRAVRVNEYGHRVLGFWPLCLPVYP